VKIKEAVFSKNIFWVLGSLPLLVLWIWDDEV
jgi:hypothetical protein